MTVCEVCQRETATLTAYVNGKYYRHICVRCMPGTELSSNAVGYDRRRQYEDNAQETIQPYDAAGKPRSEFYRLYPDSAKKIFSEQEINDIKRKL